MKNIFLFTIFFHFTIFSFSQPTSLMAMYDQWYGAQVAYDIKSCSQGGYIMAGMTMSGSIASTCIEFLRIDSVGNILWQKRSDHINKYETIYQVLQTEDKGFIGVGYILDTLTLTAKVYLIKLDSSGNLQWNKAYKPLNFSVPVGISIQPRDVFKIKEIYHNGASNGYALLSNIEDGVNNISYLIIRVDLAGNVLWSKAYENYTASSNDRKVRSFDTWKVNNVDSGFVIVGTIEDTVNWGGSNIAVIKTDIDGNLLWEKIYGDYYSNFGKDIKQTSDGGFIVCGSSQNPSGNFVPMAMKIDSSGNIFWCKIYNSSTTIDEVRTVQITYDGNYILGGSFAKNSTALIKIDKSGSVLWSKSHLASNIDAYYTSMCVLPDSGFAIAGYSQNYSTTLDAFYFAKTDSLGDIACNTSPFSMFPVTPPFQTSSRFIQDTLISLYVYSPITALQNPGFTGNVVCISFSDINEYGKNSVTNVFPNPSPDGAFTIEFVDAQKRKITVSNMLGQEIHNKICKESKIELSFYAQGGIYFMSVYEEDGASYLVKLVVE